MYVKKYGIAVQAMNWEQVSQKKKTKINADIVKLAGKIQKEKMRVLQEHAFCNLGCSALWCGYYDGNEKSKRCQEKCGFTYHHTEENKPCVLMGDVRTEHFTRITKKE